MAERKELQSTEHNEQSGLPPKAKRWPTAEELRKIAAEEPDPRETMRELRRKVPLAGSKTLDILIRGN